MTTGELVGLYSSTNSSSAGLAPSPEICTSEMTTCAAAALVTDSGLIRDLVKKKIEKARRVNAIGNRADFIARIFLNIKSKNEFVN